MSKNAADLRFAVSDADVGHSTVWRVWISRHGDVYVGTYGLAGNCKISFHQSGICRYAFTKEHAPSQTDDRAMQKWQRAAIPAAGQDSFCRLLWLAVPTDYLSQAKSKGLDKAVAFEPAPAGQATFVEIGVVDEPKEVILSSMPLGSRSRLELFCHLPIGPAVFLRWYHGAWENQDLHVPASHGLPSYDFEANTTDKARPYRIVTHSNPKDGDALLLTELGGTRRAL